MPLKSPLKGVDVPHDMLLPDYIIECAARFGDRTAMQDATSGRSYTFKDLAEGIVAFAAGLHSRGFQRGDVMCIYSPNCIEYPIVFQGVVYLGGVISTANPLFTEREICNQVRDSGATYMCCTPDAIDTVTAVENNLKSFKDILVVGPAHEKFTTVEDVVAEGRKPNSSFHSSISGRSQSDRMAIIYSSGTTGFPKGIAHSHKAYLINMFQLSSEGLHHIENDEGVTLSVLPFYHMWGQLTSISYCLVYGVTNIVYSRFNLQLYMEGIEKYEPTLLYLVPPIIIAMVRHASSTSTDLSSVKHAISAAAPLRKNQIEAFKALVPNADVKQGFGMSEGALTIFGPVNCPKPESSGILMPDVEAKVVGIDDDDRGQEKGPMEQGELWYKAPSMMEGYINRPQDTKDVYSADGWFMSGDVGYYDDDGFLYIVDRIKEIINYKGFNVCPAELESLLLDHPDVADVAVVGVPDEAAVELPRAYVVLKPGAEASEEDVANFLTGKVAPYKKLRGGVRFTDQIPKSPSGKILRRLLRESIKAQK